MNFTSRSSLLALATSCAFLTACDSDPAGPGDGARLSIYLTDAPGDVERAWVEIVEISVRSGDDRETFVPEVVGLIELTDLVDELQLLVDDEELEPGDLDEIRLVIGDGVLEAKSGEVYVLGNPDLPDDLEATGELQCPSCQQSGIKIKISNDDLELEEGDFALILDFDVAQSFGHRAGNSGRWVMHPVIHGELVAVEDVDDNLDDVEGVVVAGVVTVPECPVGSPRSIEDFVPTATAQTLVDDEGDPIVRTGVVAPNGAFSIGGMEPDTYTLGFQDEFDYGTHILTFNALVVPAEVTVTEDGSVVVAAFTLTSAVCAAAP
jgi:hypothetical protein